MSNCTPAPPPSIPTPLPTTPVTTYTDTSRLRQRVLNDRFGLRVVTFAELVMPNVPLRINKIERWPVLVVERTPDRNRCRPRSEI
jgi:hypothetical protein